MIVGIVDDGARDRDALLLTARELARVVVHSVLEADHAERGLRALLALGARQAREQERQLDVLERGEHRHQVVGLEDEADGGGAELRELAVAHRCRDRCRRRERFPTMADRGRR